MDNNVNGSFLCEALFQHHELITEENVSFRFKRPTSSNMDAATYCCNLGKGLAIIASACIPSTGNHLFLMSFPKTSLIESQLRESELSEISIPR